MFSYTFCKMFKHTFFTKHVWKTASVPFRHSETSSYPFQTNNHKANFKTFPDKIWTYVYRLKQPERKLIWCPIYKALVNIHMGSSIKCVFKIFQKTNISNPLIRTSTFAYEGVRNVSFSENLAYVLNDLMDGPFFSY